MTEFPGPRPQKPEVDKKVIEQIVESPVVGRKKSIGRQLKEVFIGGDSKSVVHYMVFDVLIPQAKDMITEAASSGFERLIFGDGPRSGRRVGSRPGGIPGTNYNRITSRGNNPIGRQFREEERSPNAQLRSNTVDDMIFATRVEADMVLDRLNDLVQDYGQASVADLSSMIGWTASFVDGKWGWNDLRGCDVRRTRDGYILILPKSVPLD